MKRIVTALMPSLVSRCFSLFLPRLRILAKGKRSQNCLRFGIGGPSLYFYPLLSRSIIFFTVFTNLPLARKKKNSGEAICRRQQRVLSRSGARLQILSLIARLCHVINSICCLCYLVLTWIKQANLNLEMTCHTFFHVIGLLRNLVPKEQSWYYKPNMIGWHRNLVPKDLMKNVFEIWMAHSETKIPLMSSTFWNGDVHKSKQSPPAMLLLR